ncbi:member of asn/thr-rich large protein family [Methanosphaera stadtmanae DSM 3091]|uniref:Member of asn/thr-rich large protein family n=2 Tax=Methanosphaera stadtmanae TaxID=2317 RepID=Q2NEI2_METST|nr:member of asn/thr-rich large protein family [Methanosphaera stadtmanae DSM 3091]
MIKMKNKILISSIILIVLLLGLSAISATDTNTTTPTTTNIIEKQTPTTSTPTNTDYKEKQDITKEVKSSIKDTKKEITPKQDITKEVVTTNKTLKTKTLKTTPVEKTVNNFTEIEKVFSEISQKSSSYEWIINLEPGNYSSEERISCGSYLKDVTINGNNQTIDFEFNMYNYNLTFNDSILTKFIYAKNLTLHNCTVDSSIRANYIIIDDNCIIKENTLIEEGTVITNKTNIINYYRTYNGNYTLNNFEIKTSRTNNGNLTLNNCTLNAKMMQNRGNLTLNNCTLNATITNRGNLTISDDTILGSNALISGKGIIITNKTDIIKYIDTYNGNYTFNNITLSGSRSNYGNLTIINSILNTTLSNYGNLTIINCTMSDIYDDRNWGGPTGLLRNQGGNLIIINSTLTNNSAKSIGYVNVIYNNGKNNGNLTLINTTMSNNNISCIYSIKDSKVINVDNCIFKNNNRIVLNLISETDHFNVTNSLFDNNNQDISVNELNIITNIYNSTFTNGGSGVSISSRNYTTIDNCTFRNKSCVITNQYEIGDCYGAALYLTGWYSLINNTIFENNYIQFNSSWAMSGGAAIAGSGIRNLTVTNCIFKDNNMSSVKAQYMPQYGFDGRYSGSGADIYMQTYWGNCLIENNTFTNSYASGFAGSVFINSGSSLNLNTTFVNNTFKNVLCANDTLFINVTNDSTRTIIENNSYDNCTIAFSNLTLNNPGKVFVNETAKINGSIILKNPESYDKDILNKTKYAFYIGKNLYKIEDTLSTEITRNTTDNIILYAKPTITSKTTNILVLKLSQHQYLTITPENYESYIFNNELIGVDEDTNIIFKGDFINKGQISITTPGIIINGENATFTNTSFELDDVNITIKNMKINNTDTTEYTIKSAGNNNKIINNTIYTYNTNGKTAAIANTGGSNILISNNTVKVYGPALTITYGSGTSIANTQGILSVGGENNIISKNNVKVYNSTNPDDNLYSTIEGITAPGKSNNILIINNNVTVTGGRFNYGINTLDRVNNTIIKDNNIHVTGHRYVNGIQMGNKATNCTITGNNITGICYNTTTFTDDNEPLAYGIITTSMGGGRTNNITITNNNIQLNSSVIYGMEIYQTSNTTINNNTILGNGNYTMGIGLAHSEDNTIINNEMILYGNSNIKINDIVEEIRPANTGIQIQQNSHNTQIDNNTIIIKDIGQHDLTINTENSIKNTTITNNKLTTSTKTGTRTINTNYDTYLENNTRAIINTKIVLETINAQVGDTINLKAHVYDIYGNPINTGRVVFKINGKTIKDTNGNIIYATVKDGIATIENYTVPANWFKIKSVLNVVYGGTSTYEQTRTNNTIPMNITKKTATMTMTTNTTTAKPGQTIKITVKITEKDTNVNEGRVLFKVNGKTMRDNEGYIIYHEVKDGLVTITYTIPENARAQDYTFTCVYGNKLYNRNDVNSTITVVKN